MEIGKKLKDSVIRSSAGLIPACGGNTTMILCFSGTGNSRYIAERIAEALQDEIVDLNAKIKAADYAPIQAGEDIVLVTPTYAWRIPQIVSVWLTKAELLSASSFSGALNMAI